METSRYRVTWKDQYLLHVIGVDADDAVNEARSGAARSLYKPEVIDNLTVAKDQS
jgi:hypothetical protein